MASEQNVRPAPQRQPSRFEKIFNKSSTTSTTPQNSSITPPKVTPPPSIHVSSAPEATNGDSMTVPGPAPASAIPNGTRNTIGRQLERMFSRSGKSKESGREQQNHNSSEHTSDTDNTSIDSNNGESKLNDTSEERKLSNIEKPSFVDRKISHVEALKPPSVTERKPSQVDSLKPALSDRKGSSVSSQNGQQPCGRFRLLDDGGHEHLLKSAKRQEKLSGLLRDMMGGKKREDQVDGDGLGLVSSWIDQLKADKDKLAQDKKSGPAHSATLVEKYGKCQEVVGRGAFGVVRISHKVDPNNENREQLYAVKEFRRRPQETPKKYTKRLTSEFCISSSLRHPNVIHTLDLIQDAKGDYCEVMEYCAGGDLYSLVLAAGKLEVIEADCYFKQLMRGVEYMHEMGVAHRDLKPENLLLTCHGSLKITDFGNGECFRMAWEKEAHKTSGLCGSAPYISPEEYTEKDFDPRAVDVWATGVIYMAMRTGRHLWRVARRDEDEYFDKYLEGRKDEGGYSPIEGLHRARCRNVIYSILDPNPTRRITASQVLKSEWGREIIVCSAGDEGY